MNSPRLLAHYNADNDLTLFCDASPYGVGAVLSHQKEDGTEQPIAFASRSLSPTEKHYSQLDKEALALIFSVKKFYKYLYGRSFTLFTDHKPLMLSESKAIPPMASARIQRWALALSCYQYTVKYRTAKEQIHADALSRLPLPDSISHTPVPTNTLILMELLNSTPVNAAMIKSWTSKDRVLSRVKHFIPHGWPDKTDEEFSPYRHRHDELNLQDGCLLWGSRVIVSPPCRQLLVDELPYTHPGISRMKSLARCYLWWPKMDSDLEKNVQYAKNIKGPLLMPHFILGNGLTNHGFGSIWT